MVETAGIEPEDESPVNTADMGKKGANSLQFKGLQGSAGVSNKQKAEEAAHLSGFDSNAIYANMYATARASSGLPGLGEVVC